MAAKKKAAKKKAAKKGAARKPAVAPKAPPRDEPPAAEPPKRKVGERVVVVRSRPQRFCRAGLEFSSRSPVTVREAEIGTERFERILAEPMLRHTDA